jgi:hypothetical protein
MRKTALVAILISALLIPVSAQGATAKAGAKCTKLKSTQTVSGKKFTCIKSGSKLVWDKGVKVPVKPTPKPTPVVVKKSQEIKFSVPPFVYFTSETSSPDAAELVTTAGLKVTYSASGACSYDAASNSLSLNSIGTCSLTGSQAGDANYLPAPSVTRTFEVKKMPQTIEVDEIEEQDLSKASSYPIDFDIAGADTPVVITSQSPPICTVDGNTISFLAVGNCMLTFNKAGNDKFEAAPQVSTTIKITKSVQAQPGDAANPAGLGVEATKKGVTVTVDAINEEVSDAICEADSANESCIDEDGVGVFDLESNTRYVEVVFTISNNSEETWIATRIGLQVDADDENYEHTMVYGVDSLDELELEPGDSITGSYFVLLPNSDDSAETFIFYGDDTEEGMFYFTAK